MQNLFLCAVLLLAGSTYAAAIYHDPCGELPFVPICELKERSCQCDCQPAEAKQYDDKPILPLLPYMLAGLGYDNNRDIPLYGENGYELLPDEPKNPSVPEPSSIFIFLAVITSICWLAATRK